jgi:hypothetical protein
LRTVSEELGGPIVQTILVRRIFSKFTRVHRRINERRKEVRRQKQSILLKNPPFILQSLRTNGGAVEIIGDISVHAEPVEAFLGLFSRIRSQVSEVGCQVSETRNLKSESSRQKSEFENLKP